MKQTISYASCLVAALALAACSLFDSPHGRHAATSHRRFDDVAHWVKVFDDPTRDAWQKPAQVVAVLGVRAGMSVADLGAGTGYFEPYLSRAVGDEGTVLAVEVEPALIEHLRQRARKQHLANVRVLLATADDARLPDAGVDLVLIVDTIHHIDDRVRYLRKLRHALTPAGRVAIVEWRKRQTPVGPPVPHRLPRERIIEEMEAAGYELQSAPEMLPYQVVLVFTATAA